MEDVLSLVIRLEQLKQTGRTGWNMEFLPDSRFKTRRVASAESVADHSWGVAMFALVMAQHLKLDVLKTVWMALVHDVSELITLDIVTVILDKEERIKAEAKKRELEDAAMREIFLPMGEFGTQCYELWLEFEEQVTPEARLLKQVDKLETCIQAVLYGEQGHEIFPQEFLDHADAYMQDAEFVDLMALLRLRLRGNGVTR